MDLPSRQDLFAVARRFMKGLQAQNKTRVNVALVDVEGSDLNLQVGQASVMGEAIVAAWAKCARGLFVDTARDDQLDRIVFDRFGILRKPANAATVDVILIRPTFAAGGGTIPAGTRMTTAAGSIFALQTDVVFGATDLFRGGEGVAQIVGSTQNIPVLTLTAFVDQPFDPTITVTNFTPAAGGTDRESDASLRSRARTFFLTLRRGILAAIQFGATTVDGVSVATAFEIVNLGNALPAGAVELIIADDNGNASGAMLQAVKDVLLQYRAAGIPVFVQGGTVQFEPVVYRLAFQSGIDTVAASEEVRAVMVAFAQFLRPGQPLLESDVAGAARAVPGVIVGAGSVVAPVGDVIPVTNDVIIRVRPQDVTFL
jgi:uncharacterized phage protein gp47/JayE